MPLCIFTPVVPSFHRQQRFPPGCPLLHVLFKIGIGYLSVVRGEPRYAAKGADKVACRYPGINCDLEGDFSLCRGLFEVTSVL